MNRNKLKLFFVVICIGTIVSFLAFYKVESDKIFQLNTLTTEEYNQFTLNKEYQYQMDVELYINDEINLPYVTDLYSYLLSVNEDKLNSIKLSINKEGFNAFLIIDDDLSVYMKENKPIQLCLYNDQYYDLRDIRLTTLPTMFINTDENFYSTMNLIEPKNKRELYQFYFSEIEYRTRGASTIYADKHHYRMSLKDSGENKKMSLLNMREDDDWILNSFVVDPSASIETLCITIWNNLCPQYKHEIKYIELVINGLYQGYYGLMDRVDFKTFNANKDEDIFIKINKWKRNITNPILYNDLQFEQVYDSKQERCLIDEFEVDNCTKENFKDVLYLLRSISELPENPIDVDYDSFAAHDLFVGLVSAYDNLYKNQRILAKNIDNQWKLFKANWDNDWSFTFYDLNTFSLHKDQSVPSYAENDPAYYQLKKDLYSQVKKEIFNKEYLMSLMDSIYDSIAGSGASIRDNNLWFETYALYTNKMTYFDECFNLLYNDLPTYIDIVTNIYDQYFGLD